MRDGARDHRDGDTTGHRRSTGVRMATWREAGTKDCDDVAGLQGNQRPVLLAPMPSVAGVAHCASERARGRGRHQPSPSLLTQDADSGAVIVVMMTLCWDPAGWGRAARRRAP